MMGKKKVAKKRGGGSMVKKRAKGGGINQHKRMAMGLKKKILFTIVDF